ncbi:hypothetical protein Tco_1410114 [Tanacetum coccineum]
MSCSAKKAIIAFLCGCFSMILLSGMVVLLVVLFDSPSSPTFSINLFDNQALNMTRPDDSPANFTIHFDLKLKNENVAVGLHYPGPITITFSYFPNVSMMVPLAKYRLDSFYQGNGKTKHVRDFVETNIFPTVLEGTDMVAFRVDTVATYRYKKVGRRRHRVEWGCVVGVNYPTNRKMQMGFVEMVQPGLDSVLQPEDDDDY